MRWQLAGSNPRTWISQGKGVARRFLLVTRGGRWYVTDRTANATEGFDDRASAVQWARTRLEVSHA